MFESIRDKFYTVQQDISASLRSLTVGDSQARRYFQNERLPGNINAGADLLNKYQSYWMELHKAVEENAQSAEDVDNKIESLHQYCQHQWDLMGQFNSQLALLPNLNKSIQDLLGRIGILENSFEEVESALVNLEDVIEIQEMQEKQLDHRFQLALRKENKLADLEQLKAQLATEHAVKVLEFESKQQTLLRERQEAFKEAFEEEMQHYKTHGHIERLESTSSDQAMQLEEIQLDDDSAALDEFLAEEATEENVK